MNSALPPGWWSSVSFRTEIGLALLILTALVLAVVVGRPRPAGESALDARASSLLAGPAGSKAPYEVLARLGVPVERRRSALFNLANDSLHRPGLLALLAPPIALLPAELEQVVRYVRAGGAVLAAGEGGGITRCAGWEAQRTEERVLAESVAVVPPVAGLRLPRVRRILQSRRGEEEDLKRRLRKADDAACGGLLASVQDTLLRLADGRPVILRLRYPGGGSVTLVAESEYFRNRAWRASDAPAVVTPLFLRRARGRVSWDEYHQGFGRDASTTGALVGWLLRSPGGWALLQLAAVALVGIAVAAVRFGPTRAVIERRRRSPLEHLEALAAGLESAAGADTAVELTIAGLRRRLHRTEHGSAADARRWLAALELSLPTARGRAAVRRLQRIGTQPGGAERVLAAAQAVEDVWEELRPRATRD
ncbi:MAG: hypothetical protein HYS40_06960 [Gemmatimonadetes bacterium]|nr:hypothetical protein [Gemmatimonadota bacterium]